MVGLPLIISDACFIGVYPAASTNIDDYVGEYVLEPNNAPTGEYADFVILKKDRSALEIRFSKDTGQVLTTQKSWYLSHTTGENVVIGTFSDPITVFGSQIKLHINHDLGQYYDKIR